MHAVVERAKKESRSLLEPEAFELFAHYRLPVPAYRLAGSREEAARAASEIGFPVVLKVVSAQIVHKSDIGGVKVGLETAESVGRAWDDVMQSVRENAAGASVAGMLVCAQVERGLECIVGMTRDPQFGPAIMFGLGGVFVELLKDVSFRVLPISRKDAREMVEETKGYPLIRGVRGSRPKDAEALIEFIVNTAALIEENPAIRELDVNPVAVLEKGVMALDARVLL